MTARKTTTTSSQAGRDVTSEVGFLTRALKAPTLREAVGRLTERARAESWTHEEFVVACLQREVSARESHGGEGRIRAVSQVRFHDAFADGNAVHLYKINGTDVCGLA